MLIGGCAVCDDITDHHTHIITCLSSPTHYHPSSPHTHHYTQHLTLITTHTSRLSHTDIAHPHHTRPSQDTHITHTLIIHYHTLSSHTLIAPAHITHADAPITHTRDTNTHHTHTHITHTYIPQTHQTH